MNQKPEWQKNVMDHKDEQEKSENDMPGTESAHDEEQEHGQSAEAPENNEALGGDGPLSADMYEQQPCAPKADAAAHGDATANALEEELNKTREKLLRAVAETENIRKRAERERQDATKYAVSSFARDLLDFADNFKRAMDSIPEDLKDADERVKSVISGIQAMESELLKTFEKHGIEKLVPEDEKFDPNFHEVMFEVPGSGKPAGTVVQVVEPGYTVHGRLIRPARVGVAQRENDGSGSGNADPGSQVDTEA